MIKSLHVLGNQYVMTHSLFVSQHGEDLNNNCGNQTMPCCTVRHAVKMSRDGDEIFINYAHGKPYMECENATQSCAVELTKSVSFYGINGKGEIQCRKCPRLFIITSPGFNITRINFFNLIISKTNTVVELGEKTNTELVFQNMLLMDNLAALYSKHSTACSIKIFNSNFEHNINPSWGIYLRCDNLTVHINSSSFEFTPLLLTNVASKTIRWRKTEILIQHTVFNNKKIQKCSPMLGIVPYAAILNVTITDSKFNNHFSDCNLGHHHHKPAVEIYDGRLGVRNITFFLLNNLIFENNYNNWGSLSLYAGYQRYTITNIIIKNCIFRNNSIALRVSTNGAKDSHVRNPPAVILENNTFEENFDDKSKVTGPAAIHFFTVKSRVLSCRFIDNRPGLNPYTGVVTISEARVTFFNCYFENRQITERANQLFASGKQLVYLRGENTFNLIALIGSQTVFSRLPMISGTAIIMKKNFKIICPQGYKVNSQRECKTEKKTYRCYYINVQCEQCPTKTYTLERGDFIFNKSNDIQCQKCPRGGDCDSGLVKAKPNF